MDKNSIIGLILIGAILIGFSIFNSPTREEIEAARVNDSIEAAQKAVQEKTAHKSQPSIKTTPDTTTVSDSARVELKKNIYGVFAASSEGNNEKVTIENELLKINLSSKGGHISSVELKKYKTYDKKPLILFYDTASSFSIDFISQNKIFSTDSLFFQPQGKAFSIAGTDSGTIAMRLYAGSENKYLEYVYSLKGNSYLVDVKLNAVGLHDVIAPTSKELKLKWWMSTPILEKSIDNQKNSTTIYYKPVEDEVDYISERSDEKLDLATKLKWIAFKQQFFTSVLIANNAFDKAVELETKTPDLSSNAIKNLSASLTLSYNHTQSETFPFSFYFGPSHYQTLKKYDLALEKQIPLGWGIFGWVNRFLVIPVFNFLNSFNINYGIIIFILTIIIKLVLFPLTYKAYLSTAKMKVLKPEIDEINKKYGDDDPLKKQQLIMGMYRKAGVNPLGGCLPMLLQMPILIAMFNFFPSSIELRQESFLWAEDLSTYDSIYNLPFNIPFYGDHVSLFTLLMTVSTILYTRMSNQMQPDNPQMAQMKWIMYLMPIIFLGVFNNYSAGLSYYYFLANMITFGQQYLMRQFVNEEELHRKIEENKKKPVTKSKFQLKLEEMAKQRGMQQPKKK